MTSTKKDPVLVVLQLTGGNDYLLWMGESRLPSPILWSAFMGGRDAYANSSRPRLGL